jgi:hypothetical protein
MQEVRLVRDGMVREFKECMAGLADYHLTQVEPEVKILSTVVHLLLTRKADLEVVLDLDSTVILLRLLEVVEDTLEVEEEDKPLEVEVEVEII